MSWVVKSFEPQHVGSEFQYPSDRSTLSLQKFVFGSIPTKHTTYESAIIFRRRLINFLRSRDGVADPENYRIVRRKEVVRWRPSRAPLYKYIVVDLACGQYIRDPDGWWTVNKDQAYKFDTVDDAMDAIDAKDQAFPDNRYRMAAQQVPA